MSLQRKTQMAMMMLGCALAVPVLAQSRPNLIFILTDDQGVDAIEWPVGTGDPAVHTPTLNALAAQGVSFSNCRVNPNCSPTRACLMTGRNAMDTGVCGVLGRYNGANPCTGSDITGIPAQVTNRMALQTHEWTLAEVLSELEEEEYYTILIDKWHLGYNEGGESLGLNPELQGFDAYFDWKEIICDGFEEDRFNADEHMLAMLDNALDAVGEHEPYALFYHTITPHGRHDDTDGLSWWQISQENQQSLIPITMNLASDPAYPSNGLRFLQNLEAIDSTIRILLDSLGVIDAEEQGYPYITDSDTVVFFMSDNGTDPRLAGPRAKNTLYEGGIRVPLFVMGEGVPGNVNDPIIEDRPVTHVDVFETICDIVQASESERGNAAGAFPRRGITFADAINWGDPPAQEREFTLCSLGEADSGVQTWKVALVWGDQWKLICSSGGAGFADMTSDEFYDLANDPDEEVNLIESNLSVEEMTAYLAMRDRIVDEWPTAVSQALPAEPKYFHVEQHAYFSPTSWYVLVVNVENDEGTMTYIDDEFYDHYNDPDHDCDLNFSQCRNMTPWEEGLRNALRAQMLTALGNGSAAPDVRVVDVPLLSTLVMNDNQNVVGGVAMTVGHRDVGDTQNEVEFRARLIFNFGAELAFPDGFDETDLIDAQVIVFFSHDSVLLDPENPSSSYLRQ